MKRRWGFVGAVSYIVAAALLVGGSGAVGFKVWLGRKYAPRLAQQNELLAKNLDLFCDEEERLFAEPWFHEHRSEGDAGPLLNEWVRWTSMFGGDPLPPTSPLRLPQGIPTEVRELKALLKSPPDVSRLDFSWFARIRNSNRWDLFRNSLYEKSVEIHYAMDLAPDLVSLVPWARYRLLSGLQTGRAYEAAQDVRHLAWLLLRTDSLLASRVAAALLQSERQAYLSLKDPPEEWHPMSDEQIDRLFVLPLWSSAYAWPTTPPELAQRARACAQATRCIGLGEGAFVSRKLRQFAEGPYGDFYTALASDIQTYPCSSLPKTLWAKGAVADDGLITALRGQLDDSELLVSAFRVLPRIYIGKEIAQLVLVPQFMDLPALGPTTPNR